MQSTNVSRLPSMIGVICTLIVALPASAATTVWHVGAGTMAADTNPGTEKQPLRSVQKAVALATAGDTVVFSEGRYPCSGVRAADGAAESPIIFRSQGKDKVVFVSEDHALTLGSWNTILGIELNAHQKSPEGPQSVCPERRM